MRFTLFYHSLLSDWNNDTAHFLRGTAMELVLRGHEVCVYEPREAGSLQALLAEHGHGPVARFHAIYPGLASRRYDLPQLNLDRALAGADVVIAHEWCDPELIARLAAHHAQHGGYRLLLHATAHRAVAGPARPNSMALSAFDGVLAGGVALGQEYKSGGWTRQAWTWRAAADTRVFAPAPAARKQGDVIWVGNWDGQEAELREFLIEPVQALGLTARVYGAGFTPDAQALLAAAGIEYGGWVPNFELPAIFARFRVGLHLPSPGAGLPGSRPFEILACGLPLLSAAGDGLENCLEPKVDFALARDGVEMAHRLRALLNNAEQAEWMAANGLRAVRRRHSCAHRVDELLQILASLPQPQSDLRRLAFADLPIAA